MNAFDMNTPPPVWALAQADTFSVFDPVPVGVDQQGRPVAVSLQGTTLIGGVPRMGVSNLVRLLAVAVALDARSEVHVYDFQGGLDYQCLAGRAATFVAGGSPEDIALVVNDLEHITADMARRYQTLHGLGPAVCKDGKVTEALATDPDLGLCPVFVIIDEPCFDHPEFRRLITQLVVQGPAAGINVILATWRTGTIPPTVATNAVNRIGFKLVDQAANNMILGPGAWRQGSRVILGPGAWRKGSRAELLTHQHRGIAYVCGPDNDGQLVRFAYLDHNTAHQITAA